MKINKTQYEGHTKDNTVNVDNFLYDDDDVDELCNDNLLQRNYCQDCGSKNIVPLSKNYF